MKTKWLIVADGQRAKFLRKDDATLVPIMLTKHQEDTAIEKDPGHHQSGAMSQGGTKSHHAYAPHSDFHQYEKHLFAIEITKIINQRMNEFDELVLIAPPHTLGDLRKHLHVTVIAKLVQEINKDLTKASFEDLLTYL